MERDGHKCVKCGRSAKDGIKLQVDHIHPKSSGGMATLDNGQTLCFECNIGKGARVPVAHPTQRVPDVGQAA
ncbi:MAG: HNH endonuclease [Anaerolineales bacterium]|nr:HNH endonuclease [Anaerolineales bacterium]